MQTDKSNTCSAATSATSDPQPIRAREYGDIWGSKKTEVAEVAEVARKKLRVGVSEAGRRVGESHQNAKLSDDDVRLILELHSYHGIGYKRLAVKWDVSVSCIQKICNGSRRAKAPARYR